MNPRRIVLGVNSVRQNGGIAQVAKNLIRVMKATVQDEPNRYELKVVTFDQGRDNRFDILNRSLFAKIRFLIAIRKASLRHTHFIYDSCNMAQAHPLFFPARRPFLSYLHGIEVWEKANPSWIRACHGADFLVSNSYYTKKRAEQIHRGFSHAHVCWLGTATDAAPKIISPVGFRPPHVLIVSRIDDQENYKGHLELIQSWPEVINAIPDAVLHIAGSGTGVPYLKKVTNKIHMKDQIQFHGFVSNKRLEELYSQSRVFAMPSRNEGFGLVYIEAMRFGLPVIASSHDAAQEIVVHGKTGLTVNLDQPQELLNAIIRLLKHPEDAEEMGNAGQRRWQKKFTFSSFKHRLLTILERFFTLN